jgi:hypothetical protein
MISFGTGLYKLFDAHVVHAAFFYEWPEFLYEGWVYRSMYVISLDIERCRFNFSKSRNNSASKKKAH